MLAERISTLAQNGPPPDAACTLYPGDVMHARLKPFGHRFVYRVFSIVIDLDRLAEAGRMSKLLSVNRANLASFRRSDHVERTGETVRQFADRLLAGAGLGERAERILLMCYPRIFGYVFNPISVYYCYRADGSLLALIYAVRNTFGQRHTYVAPVMPGELTKAAVRQARTKISTSRLSSIWARATISAYCRRARRSACKSMRRKPANRCFQRRLCGPQCRCVVDR